MGFRKFESESFASPFELRCWVEDRDPVQFGPNQGRFAFNESDKQDNFTSASELMMRYTNSWSPQRRAWKVSGIAVRSAMALAINLCIIDINLQPASKDQAEQVAFDMQTMITNFVLYGHPKIESFDNIQLSRYAGDDRATFVFNGTRLYTVLSDPWKNARCDW